MSVHEHHCRHSTHTDDPLIPGCALGIDVRAHTGGPDLGWRRRNPCYLANRDNEGFVPCDKAEPYTQQELDEFDADAERSVQRMQRTMPLIARIKSEHRGKSWSGSVECPECGGALRLTHAAYNGHTSGRCETEGCLSWIE